MEINGPKLIASRKEHVVKERKAPARECEKEKTNGKRQMPIKQHESEKIRPEFMLPCQAKHRHKLQRRNWSVLNLSKRTSVE